MGQAFTGVGAIDPRLNSFGALDARLSALFQAWKKADAPPTRVKPLPLQIVHGAFQLARLSPAPLAHAAADCLVVAFYFLLRPGEFAGTPKAQPMTYSGSKTWVSGLATAAWTSSHVHWRICWSRPLRPSLLRRRRMECAVRPSAMAALVTPSFVPSFASLPVPTTYG